MTREGVRVSFLLLACMFVLLAAMCAEVAVYYAIGTAVRMFYIDLPAQKYDGSHLDHPRR